RIGGAGNVALNILNLGAKPIVASVVGSDPEGQELIDLFEKRGISTEGVIVSGKRKTTVKTRVISSKQQLLRIDSEDTSSISNEIAKRLCSSVERIIKEGVDAIILEDYNKGVLSKHIIRLFIELAKDNNIPITADPKKDNFNEYGGITIFKPNLKELKEGLNIEFDLSTNKTDFENAVEQLRKKIPHQLSLITLSEHGIYATDDKTSSYAKAHSREITDVSGAGDTVIATATLCYICGASVQQIAKISNIAGGMVCEKPGVVSVLYNDLLKEVKELL
ncbi:bifunctional ADP-heptose synthase, partial [Crocinitomicaceae bacterium]|nr:bifunctional ADP-heptose synthase [Crocinitomicaceae bacterium]